MTHKGGMVDGSSSSHAIARGQTNSTLSDRIPPLPATVSSGLVPTAGRLTDGSKTQHTCTCCLLSSSTVDRWWPPHDHWLAWATYSNELVRDGHRHRNVRRQETSRWFTHKSESTHGSTQVHARLRALQAPQWVQQELTKGVYVY